MEKNAELIKKIIKDIQEDQSEETIMQQLLENKIADDENLKRFNTYTFGEKAADKVAGFVGSWKFIGIFLFSLIAWMVINVVFLINPFDPYPFILLNLALSCIAAVQAPLIMMSQNRQEQKDRLRAENDYKVNLKSEIIIEDLYNNIEQLLENQKQIVEYLKMQRTLCEDKEH